ncbi:Uncharacterised protein [Mycobacteroides abscessus subsp. massiliense]|nr:Uncharacterised protein [Mycobacteroides abscessus subsp. massiliense]
MSGLEHTAVPPVLETRPHEGHMLADHRRVQLGGQGGQVLDALGVRQICPGKPQGHTVRHHYGARLTQARQFGG